MPSRASLILFVALLAIAGCGGPDADSDDRDGAIKAAEAAYDDAVAESDDLADGPCIAEELDGYPDWAADVAHDPRTDLDDDPANQCASYRERQDSPLRRAHVRGRADQGGIAMARLMGILNVTPDSFSDGGLYLDAGAAVAHGRELAAEGAEIVDVGGESTRPGAAEVSAADEIERTAPVVTDLVAGGVPVSIDTSKAAVAEAALEAGARMVNDVTALTADPDLAGLCAARRCEVVLMHMQGTPRTMQENPAYDDVVDDVRAYLAGRIEAVMGAGVEEERIWIDPGIGFGKTVDHNLELLARLGELRELGRPILIGTSRKSFLGKLTGRDVDDRLGGSIASNVLALRHGAEMLRVHDVREMREAVLVAEAIGDPEWAWNSA